MQTKVMKVPKADAKNYVCFHYHLMITYVTLTYEFLGIYPQENSYR